MVATTPALIAGLVDDAAVFPPGNAPLEVALTRHFAHGRAPYAACIGPLLVPSSAAERLVTLLDETPEAPPLRVGVVGRPGTDTRRVVDAAATLAGHDGIEVAGLEMGWFEAWRDLPLTGPLVLELPRGPDQETALGDLAEAAAERRDVLAKFRTGPTPTWPWPAEAELAGVITAVVGRDIPFKVTGGLHHAVRGSYTVGGVPEENHGLLNVILATSAALAGAAVTDLVEVLRIQEGRALADRVAALDPRQVRAVRQSFRSFGCCEVTDPLTELVDLALLPSDHRPEDTP